MRRIGLVIVILVMALASISAHAATPWVAPTLTVISGALDDLSFDDFIEESYRLYLLRSPEGVSSSGLAAEYGILNDALDNYSESFVEETFAIESLILDLLLTYDRNDLSEEQRITYDIAAFYWDDRVRMQDVFDLEYPVHFMTTRSLHGYTEFTLTDAHPFSSEQDVIDYLARLNRLGIQFDQIISQMERREALGIIAPRLVLEWATNGIWTLRTRATRSHPFYETLATKAAAIERLSPSQLQVYLDAAATAIDQVVKPAYQRLYSAVTRQARMAPDAISLNQFPGGGEAYEALLRYHTGTDLAASEIHALGLREVTRLQAEVRQAAGELSMPESSTMSAIFARAESDGGMLYGEQAVAEASALINQAAQFILDSHAFTTLPEAAVIAVGVAQGGYYVGPALDGSRPGTYYVTTSGSISRYDQPTIAYHETIPGHHIQIALAQEQELPLLRQSAGFTGFTEGWALYSERLMHELGAYDNDPYGNLGRLQYELLRAVRLVVDTGIHFMGWGFEEAVEYVMANSGDARGTAEYRVLRYTVIPGQATAYMVGMLELLDLREIARAALGDTFSLADFHDIVLGTGNVPLVFVRQLIDAWIAEQ